MHITINVPKGEELDQLLTLAEQQLADFRRTISQLQSVARSIEAQVSLSPETAAQPLAPVSDADIDQVARKLVEHLQSAISGEGASL